MLQDGLVAREVGGAFSGVNLAALVDGLGDLHADVPRLVGRANASGEGGLLNCTLVNERVIDAAGDAGELHGAGLHDDSVGGFEVGLAFAHGAVLPQCDFDGVAEGERRGGPGDGVGGLGGRQVWEGGIVGGVRQRGQQGGDE